MANRKDSAKPRDWSTLQKQWPHVNWDNNLLEMDFQALSEDDQKQAAGILEEVKSYWNVFTSNMEMLKTQRVCRNLLAKIGKKVLQRLLIVMSDATGGSKYSIYGSVAYLRYAYDDGTFGWILVAARSKLADEGLTIVVKELKGVKSGTELAKKVSTALGISKTDIYYYADNTVVLDQIEACRQNGISSLTRGVGNLIAKIANEIPPDHLNFCPSEYNSADNLTRIRTVDDIFDENSTWFTPHHHFNQTGVPKFERVQLRKVFDDKPDKHSASQAEMKINKEMACMTIDHLAKVSPEKARDIKRCKCAARSLATSKVDRFCGDCYLDFPPEEKEICVVAGESDDTKNNTNPKETPSTLAEIKTFLDE